MAHGRSLFWHVQRRALWVLCATLQTVRGRLLALGKVRIMRRHDSFPIPPLP
ncbi:hypothetical protein SZ55_1348 [Pseudomonas sp. FeS53a]|nr:hypothetical protein SZ55_1348 [Pseudomonas sp. FeS53a]